MLNVETVKNGSDIKKENTVSGNKAEKTEEEAVENNK